MSAVKQPGSGTGARLSGLTTNISQDTPCVNHSATPEDAKIVFDKNFMYLNIFVGNIPLTALLDSGSSINVMSVNLFQSIPSSDQTDFSPCDEDIILANNQTVNVQGTAKIKLRNSLHDRGYFIVVHILKDCSHPLILGTVYMKQHKISLDFGACCSFANVKKTTKVKCRSSVIVQPNSECLVAALLDDRIGIGMQGLCIGHSEVQNKGLLVSKTLVTCAKPHVVHLKVLNPGNETVHIPKGTIIANFELCTNYTDIISLKSCSHIRTLHGNCKGQVKMHVNEPVLDSAAVGATLSSKDSFPTPPSDLTEFEAFKSNFQLNSDLTLAEQSHLLAVLFK